MRKPISARAGTTYSSRTHPVPWLVMSCKRAFRPPSSCVTAPVCSSGTSMVSRSVGSWRWPSTSRVSTSGLPTVSSNPSRLMVSTSTASCSSPRPWTSQVSGRSVENTRMDTLSISSWSSRAFISRAVRLEPSRPASGELLTPIVIASEGSSTVMAGNGRGSSASASVSPMVTSSIPDTPMSSPGPASSTSTRSSASVTVRVPTRPAAMVPSALHQATVCPLRMVPCSTRHKAMRPT